ncbi:MAG: hypothetical protein ACRD3W_10570, partial [Terriglobales bacterium]
MTLTNLVPGFAAVDRRGGYAGVEYYGSSQLTKLELEKMLGLKPGASPEAIASALVRLKRQLESKHIEAHAEVVAAAEDQLFIVVDVVDSSSAEAPVRKLKFPHHVNVTTEKPFALLSDLNRRLDELKDRGQPSAEQYIDGAKRFQDEPAQGLVNEILRYAPKMRKEFLAIVETDPNPERRVQAIELLGWSGAV